jgi:hypothetical protein
MPNARIHKVTGSAVGAVYALVQAKGQPGGHVLVETLGGAAGGALGGLVPDRFDPPLWPGHRSVGHGIVPVAVVGDAVRRRVEEWQQSLRAQADQQAQAAASAAEPLDRLLHGLLELLLRFLAGAVAGFAAGYVSHVALDAFSPAGLPLLA